MRPCPPPGRRAPRRSTTPPYAALTLRDDRPGRALVLIFSDGDDTSGWLSAQAVVDIARRNDAVVYAVGLSRPGVRTGPAIVSISDRACSLRSRASRGRC